MRIILYIIISLLLIGCNSVDRSDKNTISGNDPSGSSYSPSELYRVDISKPESRSARINISDYCQSVQYVPLETNDNLLVENIMKVEIVLPYIVVSTIKDVLVFDINGRYVRNIGKAGNGPGEYSSISDICLSESDTSIFIASIRKRCVLHYSFDGELIDSLNNPFPVPIKNICYSDQSLYCSYPDIVMGRMDVKNLALAIYDAKLNLKREFYSNLPTKENPILKYIIPDASLYKLNGRIYFKQVRNDTLFEVRENMLIPKLIFSPGGKKMTLEEFNYEGIKKRIYGDKYILFEKLAETDDNVFFSYKYDNRFIKSVYSKQNRDLVEAEYSDSEYNITDDLNNDLPFWPESLSGDNYLVGWLYPASLSEEQLKTIPCGGTYVSGSDNPVIQIGVIRK